MSIIEVENVSKTFRLPHGASLKAVDDVSFSVEAGDCLGIIGESGSGKSTLGRLILRLHDAESGTIRLEGEDILRLSKSQMRRRRRAWQVVFQEPFASLNPRLTVRQIVDEPLVVARGYGRASARLKVVAKTLHEVGLSEDFLERRPGALSGGQQQRVGIARALVTSPTIVVLDEPTSSLDLTIRASVLQMLARLQESRGLTYVFISHDIDTVRHFCTRVAVMRNGKFVEEGTTSQVLDNPQEPYTQSLMQAAMKPIPYSGAQADDGETKVLEFEPR